MKKLVSCILSTIIVLSLCSYTAEADTIMETILGDLRFIANLVTSHEEIKTTDAFVYEDADSPASFQVPANWKEVELSKEREIIKAKFVSEEEPAVTITFGSLDIWGAFPAEYLNEIKSYGFSRKDMNTDFCLLLAGGESFFTAVYSDLGADESDIELVNVNNQKYYKAEVPTQLSLDGIEVSITNTIFSTIVNGYMYQFSFCETSNSPYYSDFDALIESVQFY